VFATGIPTFARTSDYADQYQWVVTDGVVLASSDPYLGGYPSEIESSLDELARTLDRDGVLTRLTLIRMGWALPPLVDGYVLRYSDGSLEHGTILLVTVDRLGRRIISITPIPT
jgi:hypothetical protein